MAGPAGATRRAAVWAEPVGRAGWVGNGGAGGFGGVAPSQAAAAASIGPDPGPQYIRPELISGGNAPKSNQSSLSTHDRVGDPDEP